MFVLPAESSISSHGRVVVLRKQMIKAAENLEFEQAAKARDEIKVLEEGALGL